MHIRKNRVCAWSISTWKKQGWGAWVLGWESSAEREFIQLDAYVIKEERSFRINNLIFYLRTLEEE